MTTDPLIIAMFEEYCKHLTFAKSSGAGYCVYFTDSFGIERAVEAPSGKSVWKKPQHAKSAMRTGVYRLDHIYKQLLRPPKGCWIPSEIVDRFWEYAWTIFKIKKSEDSNLKKAIDLLKQNPPDVVGALDILEKI